MLRYLLPLLALVVSTVVSTVAHAATLTADVRNEKGRPVRDAVIWAMPDGRDFGAARATATMDQRNRQFVPHVLPVQRGTSVRFPNSDDVRHQVYSFSPAKTFQLPLYIGMPANPIVFDKTGVVTLGCNIHDRMTAYVVVVDTPYFATSNADGQLSIANLGSGKYTLHVWHPDLAAEPQTVTLGAAEQRQLSITMR